MTASSPNNNKLTAPNYTQIPNVIFDYWMPLLSAAEFKILLVICRKTFGWHRSSESISKNRLCFISGMSKNTVQTAIEGLESRGLLIKKQTTTEYGPQPNLYYLDIDKPTAELYEDIDQNLGEGRENIDPGVGKQLTQLRGRDVGQSLTPLYKDIKKEIIKEKNKESVPTPEGEGLANYLFTKIKERKEEVGKSPPSYQILRNGLKKWIR